MMKKWLPWVVKIALTVGVFWYLLGKIDLADAWEQAKGIDPGMLAASVAVLMVQFPIGARRWLSVLTALQAPIPFRRALAIYYIGCFFNLALPSSVGGDAVRMWFGRRAGLSLGAAVNSVMIERVATVFGLVLLVAAMQPVLMRRVVDLPGAWVFPALTAFSIAGIVVLMQLDRLPGRLHRWKVVRGLAALARDARRTFLDLRSAVRTLIWAVLGHINLSLTVYLLALGLDIDVGVLDCLALVPPVILVTTLPISIAGWGVREGAMIAAFGFAGVPAHSALVLSVIWGVIIILTALPGGLVWLMTGGGRPGHEAGSDAKDQLAVAAGEGG